MENTGLQYENSLTRQAEEAMDMWTKELADMSEELMNDPMAVVRSLNDARNLCTAGFLMRRQIQVSFPELLGGVSEETGESYEDLTVNNNVPWPEKFLKVELQAGKIYVKGTGRGSKGNRMVSVAQ